MVIRANAWFSRSPKVIIFNSRTSADQHAALGFAADSMRVIPNGFDTNSFIPNAADRRRIRTELRIPDSSFLIGKIARFHPMKDHSGFLLAARLVAQQIPEAHFLLAGPGVDNKNDSLLRTIDEYGIRNRVHLLGERDDVPALNAALDTAVSGSAWGEGFSNVIGEALSCGIPVVATDVGDSKLIVGEAGYVVPPSNPEALAECLVTLYHAGGDRRRYLGELGREHVKKHYSIEKMVEQYRAVWKGTALCEKLE
jgi:glycosyltransferase involved in cell wall biosynthesis